MRELLLSMSVFISMVSCHWQEPLNSSVNQPNIIVILADDMGYQDLSCFGGQAHTPHLDKLAAAGIRFTQFYAAAPNCSPSRVGYMTGKNPSRVGMYNYRPPSHPMHLRASEITLAEVLQSKNYQTGHFGKWHLGALVDTFAHPSPLEQGFDTYFATENNALPSHKDPINFIKNDQKVGKRDGYSCQIVVDEAIEWLTSLNQQQSFFLNISFHEPHKKVASPPHLVHKYSNHSLSDAEYFANIENLDLAFGRLYQYLMDHHQIENTLIVFASDNGSYRQGSNGNLKAGKSYVYEGGIRVPGLLSWPAQIEANQINDTPVGLVDLFPTLAKIVEYDLTTMQGLVGTDISPLWSGNGTIQRSIPLHWFFYRTDPEMAVRYNDYVIVAHDQDDSPHTHPFAAADQAYIQTIEFDEYKAYHLKTDIEQQQPITDLNLPALQWGMDWIQKTMDSIKMRSYQWENLPEYQEVQKRSKLELSAF